MVSVGVWQLVPILRFRGSSVHLVLLLELVLDVLEALLDLALDGLLGRLFEDVLANLLPLGLGQSGRRFFGLLTTVDQDKGQDQQSTSNHSISQNQTRPPAPQCGALWRSWWP